MAFVSVAGRTLRPTAAGAALDHRLLHGYHCFLGGMRRQAGEGAVEGKQLQHIDERLGRVAVDMGLLTQDQVDHVNIHVLMSNATGVRRTGFGEAALELGHIDKEKLAALAAEEHRRRRLITGYEIVELIGTGTIATVYRAVQLSVDREVALKILRPRLASDPVFVRAYIAEAQAVSRFHHPNIVQGFDAGESNGFYYFAHEYLSGGSIADRLKKSGAPPLTETRLLAYLRQTTAALAHAWAVAVYHGDINPGNLLLDAQDNIKLANLGVPRVAVLKGKRSKKRGIMPGFVRCGPEYAAPEQLDRPELVNARTDMYSLGATFYHISFGAPPFSAPDGGGLKDFRKTNPMPSFALKSQEAFSGKYLRLLHDMLDPDPEKRPADPEELAARLEKFHLSGGDDLGSLARQVRQAAPPAASSGRFSARTLRAASAPAASSSERKYSLKRRDGPVPAPRFALWLAIAAVLAGAAVLALLLLK